MKRILLVEDDPLLNQTLAFHLKSEGLPNGIYFNYYHGAYGDIRHLSENI